MADKDDKGPPGTISLAQAAALLMVTQQWVRVLVKRGYIEEAVGHRYKLVSVVQGCINFLKEEKANATRIAGENRVRDARAAEIEMRNAERRRELISIEDARLAVSAVGGAIRADLASLPARITRDLALRRKIEDAVDDILVRASRRLDHASDALASGVDPAEAVQQITAGRVGEEAPRLS